MVSYRGVRVGEVQKLVLTHDGVDAYLDIDNGWDDKIPADALAVVGNRSAVGEQYVDLQPQTDDGPYLHDGSQIATADTRTPLPDPEAARRHLHDRRVGEPEVAAHHRPRARHWPSPAPARTCSGSSTPARRSSTTANRNFDVTTALIRDGNTVLHGQIASADAIRSFARDLRLFSGTLAGHDRDLRRVIDNGSVTATQLRTFLDDNQVDLAEPDQQPGHDRRHRGQAPARPAPGARPLPLRRRGRLHRGLEVARDRAVRRPLRAWCSPTTRRSATTATRAPTPGAPQDGSNRPMNISARCTEPAVAVRPARRPARAGQPARRPRYRAPVACVRPDDRGA